MRAVVLLALLAGCAAPPAVEPPAAELLEKCPARVLPPAAPKATADRLTIAKFSVQVQLAREATDRSLAACSERHQALVEWAARVMGQQVTP